ncbi:hypothetical protein ACIBG8_41590 [Nonomuraea sp. NPDC050556]|uniref:hypothetical protein n=1 Tax=Nonomuraea sp. NPDC050556 TaxID=3364369 RepID=UPI0037B6B457
MARSESIRGDIRAARLTVFQRRRAARNGRADGRHAIPQIPSDLTLYGEAPVTGYLRQLDFQAGRASKQLQAYLRRVGTQEVVRIHGLARTVVAAHERRGRISAGEAARFRMAHSRWLAQVEQCRRKAQAVVDAANQEQQEYWVHVVRHHEGMRGGGARPPFRPPDAIVLDPIWDKPDPLLFLRADKDDDLNAAEPIRDITRALELLNGI